MSSLRPFLCLACFLVLGLLAGCASKPVRPLARHEFSAVHMAIPFRIVLYSRDPVQATNAAQAAWERIAELNRILSDYDPDSELSRLGATSPTRTPSRFHRNWPGSSKWPRTSVGLRTAPSISPLAR